MNNSLNISKRRIKIPEDTWKSDNLTKEWKIPINIWIALTLFCIVDRYIYSYLFRIVTAFIIPIWLAEYIELALLLLGLFNLSSCFFIKVFTNLMPFLSNMSNDIFGKRPKSNYVPMKLGTRYQNTFDKIIGHFSINKQPSQSSTTSKKQVPIPQNQNVLMNWSFNQSRNSLHSSDIYTDEQLEMIQNDSSAAFTIQYTKSDISNRFPYQIDDEGDIQMKDNSRVDDLLDISQNTSELFSKESSDKNDPKLLSIAGSRKTKHGFESTGSYKFGDRKSFSFKKDIPKSTIFSNVTAQPIIVSAEELFQEYKFKPQDIALIEERIRCFVGTHIIKPLYKAAIVANAEISKGTSSLRVGISSITDLQALVVKEQNLIPVVAPVLHYFNITDDQEFLLNKLEKWSHSDMIYGFTSESQKTTLIDWPDLTNNKSSTRLPTESELVLKLFAAFMDCQISTVPINRFHEHGKAFSSVYLIPFTRLKKEQPLSSYFIEIQDDVSPTNFRFHTKTPIPYITTRTTNAITMISCFIAQTHYHNNGMIYGLDLSDIGLGIDALIS